MAYNQIRLPKIRRNKLNLSHERRCTADMFYLYPMLCDVCIPGDKWQIANEIVLRMNPLVVPLMHEINVYMHYYFVPFRLLWSEWEDFITGGKDGDFVADIPTYDTTDNVEGYDITSGSLWDFLGFNVSDDNLHQNILVKPMDLPHKAYNMIYNEYYRDQNIIDAVPLTYVNPATKDLHIRCWEKDYFTSALPWQQRGQAPALPISGAGHLSLPQITSVTSASPQPPFIYNINIPGGAASSALLGSTGNSLSLQNAINNWLSQGVVNFDSATTFDVSDLRIAFQVQKFLERNARTGARYVEFLQAHFPAHPRDDRLQRPEYIGGSKTPIIISEVLQTSETTSQSAQGNLAGHGISADRTYCASYFVQEHGIIMGIMSIMPRTMYQQGIDRVWTPKSRYDFYFPEFSNLSEQAVMQPELFNYAGASPNTVIGYQGRFDEYRYKRSTVHGLFHNDLYFSSWALSRKFSTPPVLNADLVRPNANEMLNMKRFLAVPTEPAFVISLGNRLHVTRPMPYIAEPGLIDHN